KKQSGSAIGLTHSPLQQHGSLALQTCWSSWSEARHTQPKWMAGMLVESQMKWKKAFLSRLETMFFLLFTTLRDVKKASSSQGLGWLRTDPTGPFKFHSPKSSEVRK
ncbi:mCG1047725, partial [Mus musculus]